MSGPPPKFSFSPVVSTGIRQPPKFNFNSSLAVNTGIRQGVSFEPASDGREEDHDPNELEWEASLRRHMGTFTKFDSIDSTQRVQWVKDNLSEELNTHGSKRAQLEEDLEKLAKEEEAMKARNLLELRKAIVRAWMGIEESEWEKIKEKRKKEASTLEEQFKNELSRLEAIARPSMFSSQI